MANDDFRLEVGAAHRFELVARRVGWRNSDLTRMTQDRVMLGRVLDVIRGIASIEPAAPLADREADPSALDGMASDDFRLGVGAAHQFEIAARAGDWTDADLSPMEREDTLACILAFVRGAGKIVYMPHLVDCNADPFVPDGLSVAEFHRDGVIDLTKTEITLFLSARQKRPLRDLPGHRGGVIDGHDLRKEIATRRALHVNVLDYLLAHPSRIPHGWKGVSVFFWRTIYLDGFGHPSIRCLSWDGRKWCSSYRQIGRGWGPIYAAACGQDRA